MKFSMFYGLLPKIVSYFELFVGNSLKMEAKDLLCLKAITLRTCYFFIRVKLAKLLKLLTNSTISDRKK